MTVLPRFFIFVFFTLLGTLLITTSSFLIVNGASQNVNNQPIIGILSQEISYFLNNKYPDRYKSYIAASYVKFVEGAGARVVPIWIDQDESYYENILSKINGVVWPGGTTFFNQSRGYADAGNTIYKIAKRMNENGDYFPILGICLGFELLTYVAANRIEHRIDCSCSSQALPLVFEKDFRTSRMFENAPPEVINILEAEDVTANFHRFCVTTEGLKTAKILKDFKIISTNSDVYGTKFISTLEHNQLPFYGVQFHPEKNLYEWVTGKNIPHSNSAVKVAQYFANFFVEEARKNMHSFSSRNEELEALIYNYPATFTALKNSSLYQCYMFEQ